MISFISTDKCLFFLYSLLIYAVPFVALLVAKDIPYGWMNLKVFAFRSLTSILAIFFLLKIIFKNEQINIGNNFIFKAYGLLIVSLILTALTGVDPYHSFFSDTHRMGGIISLLHQFVFFVILIEFFEKKIHFEKMMFFFQGVSIILFVYSFLQMIGQFQTFSKNRVESLLGNPNFYGNYAAIVFLMTTYFLIVLSKNKLSKKICFYYFVCIINLIAVFTTQNRSALLGIVVAYIFVLVNNYIKKNEINYILLRQLVIILSFSLAVTFLLHEADFFEIENRGINLEKSKVDQVSSGRISIWTQATGAISEKPLLGWGIENFPYTTSYAPADLSYSPWQDRAHNIFLESLVNSGLIGFCVFIFFLIQVCRAISLLNVQSRPDHLEMLFVMYFTYYIVNATFTFDDQISAILFVVMLAYLASVTNIIKKSKQKLYKIYIKKVGLTILIFGILYNMEFHIRNLRLSRDIFTAVVGKDLFYISNNKLKLVIEKTIDSDFYDRLHELELLLAISINAGKEQPNGIYKNYIFEFTNKYILRYLESHPVTSKTYMYISQFYGSFDKNDEAINYMIKAIEKYPNNLMLRVELGKIYEKQKKMELAKEQYQIAISKDKSFVPAHEGINRLNQSNKNNTN